MLDPLGFPKKRVDLPILLYSPSASSQVGRSDQEQRKQEYLKRTLEKNRLYLHRKRASMTFHQPHFTTLRLLLRGFQLGDAPRVAFLAGDFEVACMVSSIPHPYEEAMAMEWIRGHESQLSSQTALHYAIVRQADHLLIGAMGLQFDWQNQSAELGYWTGKPYWNRGYATEAARAVLEFAFGELGLNRVEARHMTKNPASGKVMQKLGMTYEGTLRQAIYRFGNFEDAALYGILRREFSDA